MNEINEALKEFLVESHENLSQLDLDLVALEKDPASPGTLGAIFRAVHTLKGSAGFLGFSKLESVSHVGESLLSRLRDGKLTVSPTIISALLALVDAVREMLAAVEATGQDGERDYADLIETLTALRDAPEQELTTEQPTRQLPVAASVAAAPTAGAARRTELPRKPGRTGPPSDTQLLRRTSAELNPESGGSELIEPADSPKVQKPVTPQRPAAITTSRRTGEPDPARPSSLVVKDLPPGGPSISDTRIRIDIKVLDKLMNLVSELVLSRNQILQYTPAETDATFVSASRHLNLITSELQEEVMRTRMQPIGIIWNTLPRVVRDLAVGCGKQVRLDLEGSETALDKTIIEAIKDPLTHMVRNAIDHGIEFPGSREAAGKSPEGRLLVRAFHEGGQVNIEISDDGAGIDPLRVGRRAVERGLISPDQLAEMGADTLLNLIFLPGFSTAESVTNLSGRGVGMDVVRNNVEKIGGNVDIHSKLGEGTTIKIRIPLTLAIIKAMIVSSGCERYAIPQNSMLELVRLEGEKVSRGIEMIHGAPVYRYRGKLLPIVYLDRVLSESADTAGPRPGDDVVNIVVLQAEGRPFGLVVDRINDTQEIVVKPLSKQLRGLSCFAGATIMGNGKIALILDVLGIAERASVVPKVRELALVEAKAAEAERPADRQPVVLVRTTDQSRMAIPLAMVARLEEFPQSAIERVAGRELLQYRGQIIPLIELAGANDDGRLRLDGTTADRDGPTDSVHVVVCSDGDRTLGLKVDRILDIAEESLAVRGPASRRNVQFTTVIQNQVTELLDVSQFLRTENVLAISAPAATVEI
jgi:two-component system chemotaxis sensor kinase CheA